MSVHPDAVVIGAGPAGSTAARLLAEWGHQVTLLTASTPSQTLAECLPPSNKKVFSFLHIQDAIAAAGFFETRGNTVWWQSSEERVEPYPEGTGYQVDRAAFDRVLLDLARTAGAVVRTGRAFGFKGPRVEFQSGAKRVAIRSRFFLDCSGRAGVLARPFRQSLGQARTIALCGVWHSEKGWKLPDATHTLVESYGDGWAWSVPLSTNVRHVAFMVDPKESRLVRGKGIAKAYAAELAKTSAFRKIFAHSDLQSAPWGRDASLYSVTQFGGPRFVLAGDAGSFIDPLSSFGVKKALVSGWAAAVVANTCLKRPEMQEAALRFFEERERAIEDHYRQRAASWFQSGAGPFWTARAAAPPPDTDAMAAREALEKLKRHKWIRLERAPAVRTELRPRIQDREVVLQPALTKPGLSEAVDFLWNVDVLRLGDLAPEHRSVPDLYEAYCRAAPVVELPDFLRALATLVAKEILIVR